MNVNQLLKQAQNMQRKMQELQDENAKMEFEGKAGGGLVSIKMSGSGDMKKISIAPSLLTTDEKEMLEDLIIAAYNDAKSKADEASKNSMSGVLGTMGRAGMNLPF